VNATNLVSQRPQRTAEPPQSRTPQAAHQRESAANDNDRELFMQLLDDVTWQPQVPQPTDRFAAETTESMSSAASPPEWGPLQQKLTELLPERPDQSGQALEATLMMPNLGEVGFALKPMPGNGWNITLRFARRATFEKLRDSREHCRHSLADSLGRPIKLEFDDRESWA
jgi:hypothetical protein